MKPELVPGLLAISKKGRDKGRPFVVLCELDADFVSVADGGLRGLSRPKKKRRKHLLPTRHEMPAFCALRDAQKLTDQDLRGFLRQHQSEPDLPQVKETMFVQE